jgi:hypothetical protein
LYGKQASQIEDFRPEVDALFVGPACTLYLLFDVLTCFVEMVLKVLDCRFAFPLIARCDDEDQFVLLRARREELIDEARADTETEAADMMSDRRECNGLHEEYLFAPVIRT